MWHAGRFHTGSGLSCSTPDVGCGAVSALAEAGIAASLAVVPVRRDGQYVVIACCRERADALDIVTMAAAATGDDIIAYGLPDSAERTLPTEWRWGGYGAAGSFVPDVGLDTVAVVGAGTVDRPVMRDIAGICAAAGCRVDLIDDVGVAGSGRVVSVADRLAAARVVVVCAGMDGALPRVVAELFPGPVVLCPCGAGYGLASDGWAAWLSGVLATGCAGVACCLPDDVVGAAMVAVRCSRTVRGGGSNAGGV